LLGSLSKMVMGGVIFLEYENLMKTKPLTFLLALFFLISGSTTVNAKQKFGDYEGAIYVSNYDGDTITFNLPNRHPIIGKKISIRLNGIDTPEIKGKCEKEKYDAEQAREMVRDILKDAEKITLKNMQRGKYFRIASDVIVDGESLGNMLIEAGMAIRYDGRKKTHKWCNPINE
jgi:micrococcal nuclease